MKAHIVQSKTRGTWQLRFMENGVRKQKQVGTIREFATREAVEEAKAHLLNLYNKPVKQAPTVRELVQQFKEEKMSERRSTRLACDSRLDNHILPKWGAGKLSEMQARLVELWIKKLPLAPKSKAHIRDLIRQLWDYAMWRGDVPTERNPMELVTIKGTTKRTRMPHSLTVDEFRRFLPRLGEPMRTIALMCISFGLRISECLALKWSDVDWLDGKLRVERGIVRQTVGDLKTIYSGRTMAIDAEMLAVLKVWRQATQFASETDWIFASPVKLGRLPVSYPWVWQAFRQAATKAGLPPLGTHSLRHSYRSWLDAVGTPIAVQQKLMRHSDIRTTMNLYGDVVTDEMSQAHSKVVRLALAKN